MVAAFGLERNVVAERGGQRLRPDASSNDGCIDANSASFAANGPQAAVHDIEADRALTIDAATVPLEGAGQAVDQPVRVGGVPILAHENAFHIVAREVGVELSQLVGSELVGERA